MRIVVNRDKCVGHARCASAAAEVYELDENGYIGFSEKLVPAALEAQARRGARACPERAIEIVDDEESAAQPTPSVE